MYDQSKLSELIRFARVDAGSTVIDVYPGDGDWTRLFSDIVGPEGRVYSFVPAEVAHFKNDPVGRMRTLAKEPGRENVEAVSADLVAMPEVTQPADVLWLHLFYHDLHTALIQAKGATAAHFNRAVYERLKPGGSYVIVDHAAAVGAGTSDAQSLHRIEPASVREEVEAAGFVLDAESTMLANKDDPHSIKVFDPSIKGETDRFAYRFVKPTGPEHPQRTYPAMSFGGSACTAVGTLTGDPSTVRLHSRYRQFAVNHIGPIPHHPQAQSIQENGRCRQANTIVDDR